MPRSVIVCAGNVIRYEFTNPPQVIQLRLGDKDVRLEEIVDGKSEVGGFPVVRMPLKQWMLRITAYADRLIEDLEHGALPVRLDDIDHLVGFIRDPDRSVELAAEEHDQIHERRVTEVELHELRRHQLTHRCRYER